MRKSRKLSLSRETLHTLDGEPLARLGGGVANPTLATLCLINSCHTVCNQTSCLKVCPPSRGCP